MSSVFQAKPDGLHAFYVSTSLRLMCLKDSVCLLATTATPSPLVASSILHSVLLHLFKDHYILKGSDCFLEGVGALFVGTSCLLMCYMELVCLHAPMATTSTLA